MFISTIFTKQVNIELTQTIGFLFAILPQIVFLTVSFVFTGKRLSAAA